MLYVHMKNIETKIAKNYNGKGDEIERFKVKSYLPFRERILSLNFDDAKIGGFKEAAKLINEYSKELGEFAKSNGITSQSKLESTLLEEISVYLFKDIREIKNGSLDFFNKGIYAGLKINGDLTLGIIKKDVDFCIGRCVNVVFDNSDNDVRLIVPVISVEVKTYLDATMFGEIKSSSKTLKSASPNSKAYVLMGYKDLADEHIIAARQDSVLDEMFALKGSKDGEIDPFVLFDYWQEITKTIASLVNEEKIVTPGRLLRYGDYLINDKV